MYRVGNNVVIMDNGLELPGPLNLMLLIMYVYC